MVMCVAVCTMYGCTKTDLTDSKTKSPKSLAELGLKIENQILHFSDFPAYRKFLDLTEKQSVFRQLDEAGFRSLYTNPSPAQKTSLVTISQNVAGIEEPRWFENRDLETLHRITGRDRIIIIDSFAFRIADNGDYVFVCNKKDLIDKRVYDAIVGEDIIPKKVLRVPTEYDVTYMLEEIGMPHDQIRQNSIFCWSRGGAASGRDEPAVYFLDETWPASQFTNAANAPQPTSNTRLSVKLEYIKLGVFFQLYVKGKYQREDGTVGINGDNLFSNKNWGTGEGRWNITFQAKWQGRCRREQETFSNGTITPPLNNENKTRRVFWERDNALHRYDLYVEANLFTKRGWIGIETETFHSVPMNSLFAIPTPRMVNNTEINASAPFRIADNY